METNERVTVCVWCVSGAAKGELHTRPATWTEEEARYCTPSSPQLVRLSCLINWCVCVCVFAEKKEEMLKSASRDLTMVIAVEPLK